MILDLLRRLYETCKNSCFSATHIVKTLCRISADTAFLSASVIAKTTIEGSTQLFRLFIYNPAQAAIKLLAQIPSSCASLFAASVAGLKQLSEVLIAAFIFAIRTIYTGTTQLILITYRVTLEIPLTSLSNATTMIAQAIAQPLKALNALARSLYSPVTQHIKNIGASVFTLAHTMGDTLLRTTCSLGKIIQESTRTALTLVNTIVVSTSTALLHGSRSLGSIPAFLRQGLIFLWSQVYQALNRARTTLWNSTYQALNHVISSIIQTITNLIPQDFTVARSAFIEVSQKTFHLPVQAIKSVMKFIQNMCSTLMQVGASALSHSGTALTSMLQAVERLFSSLAAVAGNLVQRIARLKPHGLFDILSNITTIALAPWRATVSLGNMLSQVFTAITNFAESILTNGAQALSTALDSLIRNLGSLKEKSSRFTSSEFIKKNRARLGLVHHATRTVLAGTAGFVFFSVPRTAISGIKRSLESLKNALVNPAQWLLAFAKEVAQIWCIDVPITLFGYAQAAYGTIKHVTQSSIAKLIVIPHLLFGKISTVRSSIATRVASPKAAIHAKVSHTATHARTYRLALASSIKRGALYTFDALRSVASLTSIITGKALQLIVTLTITTPLAVVAKILSFAKIGLMGLLHAAIALATYTQTGTMIFGSGVQFVWLSILPAIAFLGRMVLSAIRQTINGIAWVTSTSARGLFALCKNTVMFLIAAIKQSVLFLVTAVMRTAQFLFALCQQTIRLLLKVLQGTFSYSKRGVLMTASAGKTGSLFLGRSSVYGLRGIWWCIKNMLQIALIPLTALKNGLFFFAHALWNPIQTALSLPGRFFRALHGITVIIVNLPQIITRMMIKGAQNAYRSIITMITNNRTTVQKYALLGTVIYTILVLATTYITPPSDVAMRNQSEISSYHTFAQALPVNTSFELQNISYAKGTFGTVSIKGILSYAYEAGLESARNLDNITIEKAEKFTIKKLGSHMNNKHIVTTRFLITATLGISASTSAAFPFAPTESKFVIKNNVLSTNEMFYLPTASSFSTEFNAPGATKIHLKHPASTSLVTKSPKLSIVLEHTGVPAYTLFTLYALIMCLTFMALASLGGLLPQTMRLAVSGVATTGLGIMWILSHALGLLPTINHLFLTLLMCLALSLLCVGFNAKYVTQKETRPEAGKTRWTLGLLTLLAVFLTLLIGL